MTPHPVVPIAARETSLAGLLAMLCLAAACSSGSSDPSPPPPPPPPAVTAVTLAPTSVNLQGIGATGSVQATVAPSGANAAVTWRVEDPTIATVASSGATATLTAVAGGTTRVIATAGGIDGSAPVTVTPVIRTLGLAPTTANLLIGATQPVTVTINGDLGAANGLTWTTSAPAVATVSAAGVITATGPGTATITATVTAFPTVSATVAVTVTAPTVRGVTVAPPAPSIVVGATLQLNPTIDADPGASNALSWTSSNQGVATVSAAGLVTAVAAGAATITAASVLVPAVTGTSAVTVTPPQVLSQWNAQQFGTWDRAYWLGVKAVRSLSNGDAFAVPIPLAPTDTRILRRTGGHWTLANIMPFGAPNGIGAIGNELWIGSNSGRIASWNGAAFTEMTSPVTGPIVDIYAISAGVAVAVANLPESVLLLQGGTWTKLPSPPLSLLTSVWATAPNDIYVVGALGGARIAHWNGTVWATLPNLGFNLVGIGGDGAGHPIVGGISGSARWNGASWDPLSLPAHKPGIGTEIFRNIVTCGPDTYAATQSRILKLVGAAWQEFATYGVAVPGSNSTSAGCGGDNVLRAAGPDGAITRWTGSTWVVEAYRPAIHAVKVVSPSLAFAVGGDGVVFRWDGIQWQIDFSDYSAGNYTGVTALPSGFAMVTSAQLPEAGILRREGGVWFRDPAPANLGSWAIWADSPTFALTVGFNAAARWNGATWSTVALPGNMLGVAMDGASASFAVAVGSFAGVGRIAMWNGTAWSFATIPPSSRIVGVDVISPTLAYAASVDKLLKWDGASWTTVTIPAAITAPGEISGVAAVSASEIYLTGITGTVWAFNGTTWTPTASILNDMISGGLTVIPNLQISVVPGFGVVAGVGGALLHGAP